MRFSNRFRFHGNNLLFSTKHFFISYGAITFSSLKFKDLQCLSFQPYTVIKDCNRLEYIPRPFLFKKRHYLERSHGTISSLRLKAVTVSDLLWTL